MTYSCPRCDTTFTARKSLWRHSRRDCLNPPDRTVDAQPVLTRIEGLNHSAAARLCGVDHSTVARWRQNGRISPWLLQQVLHRLDTDPHAPKPDRAPGAQPGMVDVFVSYTSTGWLIDAYTAGTNNPVQHIEILTSLRFATIDAAFDHARLRYGDQIARLEKWSSAS